MEIPDYPSNKGTEEPPEKNIKRVTTGDPIRKKKPLGKKIKEVFIEGTVEAAVRYVTFEVLIPAARDMIIEAGTQGMEKLFRGDSYRRRSNPPPSGPTGVVSYNRYAMGSRQTGPQRTMSRRSRSRHDFDEVILESRVEAEEVIDKLYEVVSQYGAATVMDLYELVGLASSHTDNKWGWTSLRGAGVSRSHGGYLLDLPEPQPLD